MKRWRKVLGSLVIALSVGTSCRTTTEVVELIVQGDETVLNERKKGEPTHSPEHPKLLILMLDGVGRDILYSELEGGHLPNLARLLSSPDGKSFPNAHFDDRVLSTFPSTTMVSWATALTGVPMPEHGIAGNEYFVRGRGEYVAPAPVSTGDLSFTIANYTDGYLSKHIATPTLYEQLRAEDPDVLIWVSMHPIFRGADKLFTTSRATLINAAKAYVQEVVDEKDAIRIYRALDEEIIDEVSDDLATAEPPPDVLAVYLPGTDLYAHQCETPPEEAVSRYLRTVTDPALERLLVTLRKVDRDPRYVMVIADHGHTRVAHDDARALSTKTDDLDPPALLRTAGFRLRPFDVEVPDGEVFDVAFAYQGAPAYVYLADRSSCPPKGGPCDWSKPSRFEEDRLVAAEAFYVNNRDGHLIPEMRGALDLILVRTGDSHGGPFEVYVGDGKTQPLTAYLKEHPHPSYVEFPERLESLTDGPQSDHAGDLILLAHNGDRDDYRSRFYFAGKYHSWHGSPSKQDSEVPFIIAHPEKSSRQLRAVVDRAMNGVKVRDVRLLTKTTMLLSKDAATARTARARP